MLSAELRSHLKSLLQAMSGNDRNVDRVLPTFHGYSIKVTSYRVVTEMLNKSQGTGRQTRSME